MPVTKSPGEIRTGPGKRTPATSTNKVVLTGGGLSGPTTLVGGAGWIDPLGATRDLPDYIRDQSEAALLGHVNTPNKAHPASAISVDGYPSTPLFSKNVEAALDELTGAVPPRPPYLGEWLGWTNFTAIPDWGWAKLWDSELGERGLITGTGTNAGDEVFPYFWEPPTPTLDEADPEWNSTLTVTSNAWFVPVPGQDPATDWVWNSGASLTGAGNGQVFAGGFTRGLAVADNPVTETLRIGDRSVSLALVGPGAGLPLRQEVVVSGAFFPADRGVLALIHWPAGASTAPADVSDFMSQDPLDRVVAAVLLGQGILGDACFTDGGCQDHVCDGEPGGIFAVGTDDDGHYDPFSFPGQATGQYNLDEIHLGISSLDGQALKEPFDDYTGLGNGQRFANSHIPGAGQVRLGTDEQSDSNSTYPFPVLPWGIPILGATSNAYNPIPAASWEGTAGQAIVLGNSVLATGIGEEPGFLAYRLPYLKDYSVEGLRWTPSGNNPTATREKFRYFNPLTPMSNTYPDGSLVSTLETAGYYQNPFQEDFWPWQVARYRHMFMFPSTQADGDPEDVGTYWLIHFKRERDFEAFVRDGIMPWDVTSGYEIYGLSLITSTDLEDPSNQVNQETLTTVKAPNGPAPDYGYGADPYHFLRASLFLDPAQVVSLPSFTTECDFTIGNALGVAENVVFISGVAYLIPRDLITGATSFQINTINIDSDAPHGFWDASYRMDSDYLTDGVNAPALMSSPNPMFLDLSAFGYGDHPSNGTGLSITVPTGVPGVGVGVLRNFRRHRIEVPFMYLGSNGSGYFSNTNGPARTDPLSFSLVGGNLELEGDADVPAFTKDARIRAIFRRPRGHVAASSSALPYTGADGHGELIPSVSGDSYMLHTTRFDEFNQVGQFGNFVQAGTGGPFPSPGWPNLFRYEKDVEDRFLDETYRCVSEFDNTGDILTLYGSAAAADCLNGPGMQGWLGGPIEFPVRAGIASTFWDDCSWLQSGHHETALVSGAAGSGLQVSGLPDLNIPLSDNANARIPSTGLLMYPKEDFNDPTLRPIGSVSGGTDFTGDQPSYTGLPITNAVLNYVRAFDVAWSKSLSIEEAAGQPFVVVQLIGVKLEDFQYVAPGPGRQEDDGLAIFLKVPGLTTWMDLGRVDGSGPSKQDAALDGAGCKVMDTDTFDDYDDASGMVSCQVKCNVGPAVNLFKNISETGGPYQDGLSPLGEVPVLVKVTMRAGAADYDLESEHDGTQFIGAADVGTSIARRRGLVTMRVRRLSEAL